jgi:hypothetical protein
VRCPDFSVIQINEKKLLYFQSTMFTEYPPAAELCKDRDKILLAPLAQILMIHILYILAPSAQILMIHIITAGSIGSDTDDPHTAGHIGSDIDDSHTAGSIGSDTDDSHTAGSIGSDIDDFPYCWLHWLKH